MKEDDAVESVYCSEQPLLDCGFIGNGKKAYALTSINSIEIIDLQDEEQQLLTKITKFEHDVDYIIGVQSFNNSIYVHCGNNLGEVYIYELDHSK